VKGVFTPLSSCNVRQVSSRSTTARASSALSASSMLPLVTTGVLLRRSTTSGQCHSATGRLGPSASVKHPAKRVSPIAKWPA